MVPELARIIMQPNFLVLAEVITLTVGGIYDRVVVPVVNRFRAR